MTQGNGSHVGHALTEGVLKHNQRNPGQEVLYLNHLVGTPKAFGPSGADRVKTVASWFPNLSGHPLERQYSADDLQDGKAVRAVNGEW